MTQKPNCKQISSAIKTIRNKKALFEIKLEEGDVNICLETKADLLEMIKKLEFELWPFKQEELTIERLKATYEQYKTLFESNGIVKEGKIPEVLLPDELKGETFTMPTEEQFLEYILSKQNNVKEMVKLGLAEPILVPIAADFGNSESGSGVYNYTGLLGILAKEIRILGKRGELKDSGGALLPTKAEWDNGSVDHKRPIYVDSEHQNMFYSFKNNDGTFSEGLTQKEFIQKHKDAASPFLGFAIYFKEKGRLLLGERDKEDPLKEMEFKCMFQQYRESLHKLGLTGSTVHAESIMLLTSLQNDGKVTRDWTNIDDATGFIGGNTFQVSNRLPYCSWESSEGRFVFDAASPKQSYSGIACVPLGELV